MSDTLNFGLNWAIYLGVAEHMQIIVTYRLWALVNNFLHTFVLVSRATCWITSLTYPPAFEMVNSRRRGRCLSDVSSRFDRE